MTQFKILKNMKRNSLEVQNYSGNIHVCEIHLVHGNIIFLDNLVGLIMEVRQHRFIKPLFSYFACLYMSRCIIKVLENARNC